MSAQKGRKGLWFVRSQSFLWTPISLLSAQPVTFLRNLLILGAPGKLQWPRGPRVSSWSMFCWKNYNAYEWLRWHHDGEKNEQQEDISSSQGQCHPLRHAGQGTDVLHPWGGGWADLITSTGCLSGFNLLCLDASPVFMYITAKSWTFPFSLDAKYISTELLPMNHCHETSAPQSKKDTLTSGHVGISP